MKDDRTYIQHIEECISDINSFVKGNRELFLNDKLVRNATLRSLQTLAESTTRLSDEFKEKHPEVRWHYFPGHSLSYVFLELDRRLITNG